MLLGSQRMSLALGKRRGTDCRLAEEHR